MGAWLCSGRTGNRTAWLRRLLFILGPGDGAWVPTCVARTPLGHGPSRALGRRPHLRHELTHPGISTPSPRLYSSQVLLGTLLGARGAFAVQLRLGSPHHTPQILWEYPGGVLGGTERNPPTPLGDWRFLACGCRGREEAPAQLFGVWIRAQRPGVWIPRIPRPDKETETVPRGWGRVLSPGCAGIPW